MAKQTLRDGERPDQPRPEVADVADVRELDLTRRNLRTKFGGPFLFLPWLIYADLDKLLARAGFPGSKMIPATCAVLAETPSSSSGTATFSIAVKPASRLKSWKT